MSTLIVTGQQFEDAMNQVNEAFTAVQDRLDKLEASKQAKPAPKKVKETEK